MDVSGRDRSESEWRDITALRPAFEIGKSAFYYIRAVENYQQPAAAERAAHNFVVEIAIHFWRLRTSCEELLGHANYAGHGIIALNLK